MKSLLKILFFLILFSFIDSSFAQKEKNIWYFGYQAGIDFSSGQPVALTNSAMTTAEAAAVMNDSTGKLLFYTNSMTVWNANHQIMENGDSLLGCQSTTQTLIVSKPGIEDSIYYIFTADCIEMGLINGLRYSIVDLRYNGGLGRVVEKNVLLHDSVTEKITAITHANGHDFWVLAHECGNNNFLEYLITCNGLNTTPTVISIGQPQTNGGMAAKEGYLKSSPNGHKLAMAAGPILELFDFDVSTGNIYNCLSFPNDSIGGGLQYGVVFSPDQTKLYTDLACTPFDRIAQYNLTAGTPQDIINSKIVIFSKPCSISPPDTCIAFGGMQLASDGKIYVAHYTIGNGLGDTVLGVINNPNELGLACLYNHYGVNLNGRISYMSLPNFIETPYAYIHCDDYIKENTEFKIEIYPNPVTDLGYITGLNDINNDITLELLTMQGLNCFLRYDKINNGHGAIVFSTKNIQSGIYFLKITSDKILLCKKIIINH